MSKELFICLHAVAEHWSVGAGSTEPALLIGWPLDAKSDAGVPADAASVVATALTAHYDVSFPTASALAMERASQVLEVPAVGLLSGTLRQSKLRVITTRDPGLVQSAFDDEHFPWWLQGQFLLLSAAGAPIDAAAPLVRSLLRDSFKTPLLALSQYNMEAFVIPGVDGDLIGIRSSAETTRKACADAIRDAAKRAGVPCRTMSEADFSSSLASDV